MTTLAQWKRSVDRKLNLLTKQQEAIHHDVHALLLEYQKRQRLRRVAKWAGRASLQAISFLGSLSFALLFTGTIAYVYFKSGLKDFMKNFIATFNGNV